MTQGEANPGAISAWLWWNLTPAGPQAGGLIGRGQFAKKGGGGVTVVESAHQPFLSHPLPIAHQFSIRGILRRLDIPPQQALKSYLLSIVNSSAQARSAGDGLELC